MKKWKISFIYICILLIVLTTAYARDYSISTADINMNIHADGTANVSETYTYQFSGCYNEVYRTYQDTVDNTLSPKNIRGTCSIPNCEFLNREYEWAFSFRGECPDTVTITYFYDISNALRSGNDMTLFEYTIRGEEWTKSFDTLSAKVTFPNTIEKSYTNQKFANYELSQDNTVLTFEQKKVRAGLEIVAILPKNNTYQTIDVSRGKITFEQTWFQIKQLLLWSMPILLLIYFLWFVLYKLPLSIRQIKKERKVSSIRYWREFPNLKPYIVNRYFSRPYGQLNMHAFSTTVLDFLRRGILKKEDQKIKNWFKEYDAYRLCETSEELDVFERGIYDILQKHTQNEPFSFEKLGMKPAFGREIQLFLRSDLSRAFEANKQIMIDYTASHELALLLIGFFMSFLYTVFNSILANIFLVIFGGFVCTLAVFGTGICKAITKEKTIKWLGQFELIAEQVFAYKRFISDLTMLKKYPPEAVVLWDEHLVYATALGKAKKVEKAMQQLHIDQSKSRFHGVNISALQRSINTSTGGGRSGGGRSGGGGGGGAR